MSRLVPALLAASLFAPLVAPLVAPPLALAQPANNPTSTSASNIGRGDSRSEIAPALPSPDVAANAGPLAYLHAARAALATGQTGKAQQALEMAETRLLDRSTPLFKTDNPSRSPLVARIAAARHALGAGNASAAMTAIDQALTLKPRR